MLDGIYSNPTKILFGKSSLDLLGQELAQHATRVLVVYGGRSYRQLGLDTRVASQLQAHGIDYQVLDGIQPNPTADKVYQGIALCRQHDLQLILAVGGGSVIDTAKAIAAGVPDDGDFFEFFQRKRLPGNVLPVATVLTVVGAGSESSDGAVISKDGCKYACGSPMMYPLFSVLNPQLTVSVPLYQTACGVVDAISHVMERYFSATSYVETTTAMAEALMRTLMHYGRQVLQDPENYDIRAEIMWAAKVAHDNTVGFGRKQDWATHTIAHEVGVRYDVAHGAALAVLFPAWMQFMTQKHPDLLVRFAERVFDIDGHGQSPEAVAMQGIAAYRAFIRDMGLPGTLAELGLTDRNEFVAIAEACSLTTVSGTIGNLQRLSKADVVEILNYCA